MIDNSLNKNIFRPSAVIFDMDGLMFDTENLTIPIWEPAGELYGYKITRDIVMQLIGISNKRSREILQGIFGADFPYEKVHAEFRRLVTKKIEENGVPKKPGLDFLLNKLCAAKIPFGLATSSSTATATKNLENAGVIEKFSAITCGDEVENGKPAPDIFLLAAKKLGFPSSECVGLEDSPAGLRGLHSAGIKSIFIKDVIDPPNEVLDTVWRRCNDLSEVAALFGLDTH
ncbi:MAG: HAD family phosphatase [Treponema sp.]|nr:HAD family phosphatase [Treponema sp.]